MPGNKLPSSHAIQAAMSEAMAAISELPDDEDYGLLISTIEGESDILEALAISPLERPVYTASITYPRKPIVTNADELPRDYIRESPDMIAIGKALRAGQEIPGAELKNPQAQLTIRTN